MMQPTGLQKRSILGAVIVSFHTRPVTSMIFRDRNSGKQMVFDR